MLNSILNNKLYFYVPYYYTVMFSVVWCLGFYLCYSHSGLHRWKAADDDLIP